MRTFAMALVGLGLVGFSAGCASDDSTVHTKQGAVLGAATGALVGGIIGNQSGGRSLQGAAIGGAIGAVGGGVAGSSMDEKNKSSSRGYTPPSNP